MTMKDRPPTVDISALKARARAQEAPPEEVSEGPAPKKTNPEEVARFLRDYEAINAPDAMVEDPATKALEEAAEKMREAEAADQVRYRNTPMDNREVRLAVEARCLPMDFGDLVLSGRVAQKVVILPNKLEPVYQSITGKEAYWLDSNAHIYGGATNMAVASWMGYARLAMAVTHLNGQKMRTHLGQEKGEVVTEAVLEKIAELLDMPERLLEVLLINLTWFNARVEDLYRNDFKLLKNG